MEYKVTYSNRKTIGIYIHLDASVEIRVPKRTSKKVIEEMLIGKKDWIDKTREKILATPRKEINESDRLLFIEKANELIPKKVQYFSKIMGVYPKSIRIGNAKSYWGCCSKDNRLNFSWRLMEASDDVIDYVVVHELSHIKEHNHSKKFWKEVEAVLPDYRRRMEELKKL